MSVREQEGGTLEKSLSRVSLIQQRGESWGWSPTFEGRLVEMSES